MIESTDRTMLVQGKYELIEKVTAGGFSNIYKARHITKDKYVAIKFDQDDISKKLIHNEIKVYLELLKKKNNGFLNIKSFGELNGHNFLIMDYAPITITEYVKRVSIDATSVLYNLLETVGHLHDAGYVHRDLKPDNVLVDKDKMMLIDLGMATRQSNRSIKSFVGNVLYSSFNTHRASYEYTFGDDFVSCFYIVFYLFSHTHKLPWGNIKLMDHQQLYDMKKKTNYTRFYKKTKGLQKSIDYYNNFVLNTFY